ncbi:iron complex transport system substrate-binding protein [Roseivivax marinus]|uniref:iron ABC transporter substrate-binding protein n=1 Tax=Roseivivax marinus TaxID=1379903 RepID=UPI0008BC7286|nr:iron ABC transporter substrate-binding protein [Roseivivax marinus]SEL59558.1 iron complex transport system substrate-binding protein [Roseivivax marinus]
MILRTLVALALLATPAVARTVTDSAGRTVEVPDEIETVFAAGPPASVLVYVVAPETLTGWPRALRPEERDYIAEPYRDLPETGRLTGRGGEANLERVLEIAPDLILDFGSVRDTYVDLANRVQEQTAIPYILIDGRFENTPEALRLLGEVLGKPERGEQLARDAEETFTRIDAILDDVPEEERPRTYLARGPDGLETGMKGSINTEIIERAGGANVADDGGRTQGLVQVSPEQVIVADPEIVVTWDPTFYDRVWDDQIWADVDAVQSGEVYLSPTAPFGWIDRPPSLNRMMGLRWMARLFYPERWEGDLRDETAEFYKTWYQVELGDAELDRLLEWAEGRPPE